MTLPFPPELKGSGTNKHRLKTLLRKRLLAERSDLTKEQMLSSAIAIKEKIITITEWSLAEHIGIYWAFKNELSLNELINEPDKKFYLPRIIDNNLEFALFTCENELKSGKFGIMEPVGASFNCLDIIIVPSIGININGQRLGYGKGHYDRYLKDFKGLKVAVAYPFQVITQDIKEHWDITCDKVLLA